MEKKFNDIPLTSITGSLCRALNIAPPKYATSSIESLDEYIESKTCGKGVDKIVLYNPDAIGEWISQKYSDKLTNFDKNSEIVLPMLSMIPPKTPVCFASIYSGAKPSEHGIEKYVKRQLEIDTFFDVLVRAGKKACIVTVANQSMDILFRGREIDYFPCVNDKAVVDKALDIIESKMYDVVCIYNQAYDDRIHRSTPCFPWAVKALEEYNESYGRIVQKVEECYGEYDTLIGAITDHGVHKSNFILGTHGKNIPKDMNVLHYYKVLKQRN